MEHEEDCILQHLGIKSQGPDAHQRLFALQQNIPEWHEARRFRITASDVLTALATPGVSTVYNDPFELVAQKLANRTVMTPVMKHAIQTKDEAADAYLYHL